MLIVGGIPIAMPTVLSVTMAIGALRLSKRQAIVSRLTAVEELAGMDILCSDKTGTLTLNKLSIDQKSLFPTGEFTPNDILFDASLASRTEDEDPIDTAVVNSLEDALMEELNVLERRGPGRGWRAGGGARAGGRRGEGRGAGPGRRGEGALRVPSFGLFFFFGVKLFGALSLF